MEPGPQVAAKGDTWGTLGSPGRDTVPDWMNIEFLHVPAVTLAVLRRDAGDRKPDRPVEADGERVIGL